MKKNIIAAIAAASALLLSVSCQKDDQPESQSGINGGAKTFTATIEQNLTKTTLTDAYKVNWTTGDKININGVTFKATADGTDATRATFAKNPDTQNDPTGTSFKAIFPESLCKEDAQGEPIFELPDTLAYTAGKFNAPMYAESSTQTLSFKNICAVLAIKVTKADITKLKSIKVKSDKAMCGTFTVFNNKAVLADATGASKSVTLGSASALTLDETGTTFYIAIPEQTYSYLKIYLSEDGTLYKRAMITKKPVGEVVCSKIYSIDYETNAVQIYANGPYWSTMNIGATTETGFGLYFGWGENTGHALTTDAQSTLASSSYVVVNIPNAFTHSFSSDPIIDGSTQNPETLPTTNDAATVKWGAGWRMPTGNEGEFKALEDNTSSVWIDNYNSTGIKGRKFTGNDSYSDIELFFPAEGDGSGTSLNHAGIHGSYWSSTLYTKETNSAWVLSFASDYVSSNYNGLRYAGRSVRPVSE